MSLQKEKTLGYVDIVKIFEAALDGDRDKAIRHAKRYIEKYPDRDLVYPFTLLMKGEKNPSGLHLDKATDFECGINHNESGNYQG